MKSHGKIKIQNFDENNLVAIENLKPHPRNPNKHSAEQIAVYAAILEHQGVRQPVRVSYQTGYVTKGHGQILASAANRWTHVPVEYQNYESPEQEYADLVADNALASQSEMDYGMVNQDLPNLGPDFDLAMLGIKGFVLDMSEKRVNEVNKGNENSAWVGMPEFEQADKDIKLTVIFKSEQDREDFAREKQIPITSKHSGQWTSRL